MSVGAAPAPAPIEILSPADLVAPEGFSVLVRDGSGADLGTLEVQAAGGVALPENTSGGARWLRVVPEAQATKVELTVRAGGRESKRTFPIGPPGSHVALKLEPAAPVKGQDVDATLTVEVTDAAGKPDPESAPPIIRANVGAIEGLTRTGPGVYRARYVLPDTRYPEVAVLAAFAAWPHAASVHGTFGAIRVPLPSALELPGRAEANADTSVTIAGRRFGPVKSDASGVFRIPVVVPPGYGKGTATTVDHLGNKRTSPIDLALPPTDQLACVVNPGQLPADGEARARLLCATSDQYGNIATGARVQLSASRGRLSPARQRENGVSEWTFIAPDTLGADVVFAATWQQGSLSSREALALNLVQGPAAQVAPSLVESLVHAGYGTLAKFTVVDAFKRPRPGATVDLAVGPGSVRPGSEPLPGTHSARWQAGADATPGASELGFRAWGPAGTVPAQLLVWPENGSLWAAVVDPAGLPVPKQPLLFGGRKQVTGPDGCVALGPLADGDQPLRHAEWPGLGLRVAVRDQGKLVFPRGARPATPVASVPLELLPATPVNIRIEAAGKRVRYSIEAPSGESLEGRKVAVAVSSGTLGPSNESYGLVTFSVEGAAAGATVTVVDLETGVAALVEVGR